VLLRPLPYPKPDQIISVSEVAADGHRMNFADPNFDDLRASNHTLIGMAEYEGDTDTVVVGGAATRVGSAAVSRDFFRVIGVRPVLGREFSPEEQHPGAAPATLVGYGYWRQHLGSSADLASFKLKVEDKVYSVVGVLPPGFSFPGDTEVWVPRELFEHLPSRTAHNWKAVARLRDGVTLAEARSDLSSIARRLKQQFGSDIDLTDAHVEPLRESLTASVRPALLMLLGAVGFLLLVGCANVANLMLARAANRERELAIRTALGAGRGRLVGQFLAESLLVSLAGGALGVLAAMWGVNALVALAPNNLPRLGEVSVNFPVLAFALSLSILMATALGVLTALRATSGDPQGALAEGSRGHAGSLGTQRLGRLLAAGQLAITLILLGGAGLLARSLLRVLSIDPGYRVEHIVTMELELPAVTTPPPDGNQPQLGLGGGFGPGERGVANFVNTLFDRLRAIPGVKEVGGSSVLPLASGFLPDGTFLLLDREPVIKIPEDVDRLFHTAPTGHADFCVASEGYFRALGIPLLRGRLFDDRDTADAPHVAVISQSLARATWPNEDPVGRTIEFGNMDGDLRLLTIVGIVGDIRDDSLERPPAPTVYVNYRQRLRGGRDFSVVFQTGGDSRTAVAAARDIARELDPEVVPRFRTFQQVFAASVATRRFNLTLVGAFAATALLLAVAGVYGVMAYWVKRRTREIGVRMALGAIPTDVLRLVLLNGLGTVAVGVAFGLGGSLALARTMQSLLFGVSPADPVTLLGVTLLLAGVALLASYLPAHQATKVDPLVALRHE
jgi:putative ABC transport system permease protein